MLVQYWAVMKSRLLYAVVYCLRIATLEYIFIHGCKVYSRMWNVATLGDNDDKTKEFVHCIGYTKQFCNFYNCSKDGIYSSGTNSKENSTVNPLLVKAKGDEWYWKHLTTYVVQQVLP